MGLIRAVIKSAVAAAARTVLDRVDPELARASHRSVPADVNPPAPPSPVALAPSPETAEQPSQDDIERQLAISTRTPASELKLWAEDQQRLREENRLDAPEYDPDFDDVQGGTPKGLEILRAHGYRSNPWAA